jgi:hypothetical protein
MHYIVDPTLARNCTTISPCQQDSVIIRDSEIKENIVNACGRTEIQGNIDIGEETENELAANRVTPPSIRSMLMALVPTNAISINRVSVTSNLLYT